MAHRAPPGVKARTGANMIRNSGRLPDVGVKPDAPHA